jgi:hypothetical protein
MIIGVLPVFLKSKVKVSSAPKAMFGLTISTVLKVIGNFCLAGFEVFAFLSAGLASCAAAEKLKAASTIIVNIDFIVYYFDTRLQFSSYSNALINKKLGIILFFCF